jgi:hypothetical protein
MRGLTGDHDRSYRRQPAPWKLSWERRSFPVASISETPPPAVVRRAHPETTGCEEWPADATAVLRDLITTVREEQ